MERSGWKIGGMTLSDWGSLGPEDSGERRDFKSSPLVPPLLPIFNSQFSLSILTVIV
jgi:hypothetical protein